MMSLIDSIDIRRQANPLSTILEFREVVGGLREAAWTKFAGRMRMVSLKLARFSWKLGPFERFRSRLAEIPGGAPGGHALPIFGNPGSVVGRDGLGAPHWSCPSTGLLRIFNGPVGGPGGHFDLR